MQVAAITGPRTCAVAERPEPRVKRNYVKVKIMAAPMCTEWHAYREGHATDTIGHEAAGEVVEVAQPGRVNVGDRVVVMPQDPCGACSLCLSGDYIHCANCVDPHKICDSPPGHLCAVLHPAGLAVAAHSRRHHIRPCQHGLLRSRPDVQRVRADEG